MLGPGNYVAIDSNMIKSEKPSARLKLDIHEYTEQGMMYKLLLDFDVAKFVYKTGNGRCMLALSIRTILRAVVLRVYSAATLLTAVLAIY